MPKPLSDSPNAELVGTARRTKRQPPNDSGEPKLNSTLIEFPGTSRSVPEWRKRLSQRVREIQEQKAREAAEVSAAARAAETVSCALPSGQLELVPDREQAPLNPIVSKALKRVDRARRTETFPGAATAAAVAPALSIEPEIELDVEGTSEAKPKLAIVTPVPVAPEVSASQRVEEARRPLRVISESVEDVALSYLETCLSVPALSCDTRNDIAGLTRRAIVGVLDLMIVALMVSPVAAAIQMSSGGWADRRAVLLMTAITVLATFAYLTISIALTGRTLAMRLLSVKTIDARTGLIPTGGQSIKRAIGYFFSLALLGLGLAVALIDRDHRTVHDRFSKTIVVRT
jgi:uncharacterized RDD family membrane protein YckC